MNDEIIVTDSSALPEKDEPEKQFIISNEAWHYEGDCYPWEEEVTIRRRISGEAVEVPLRWYNLLDGGDLVPCLEAMAQSWPILINHCQDILAFLAEHPEGLTPQAFCQQLLALGYVDTTPRESPYPLK